jgi:hypothetical protein
LATSQKKAKNSNFAGLMSKFCEPTKNESIFYDCVSPTKIETQMPANRNNKDLSEKAMGVFFE